MNVYTYDLTLTTSIKVTAESKKQAREEIHAAIDGATANFGSWPNGSPIIADVSIEGDLDLSEINGEGT
jgi:predicted NUDIX family NTP pyrophosphohydrolase